MQKVLIPMLTAASATVSHTPTRAWAQEPADPDRYAYFQNMMGWAGVGPE